MARRMLKIWLLILSIFFISTRHAEAFRLRDEGLIVGEIVELDCVGSGVACTRDAQQIGHLGITAGSDTVSTGVSGYFGYYPSNGTTIDDQTALYTDGTNVGIGTTVTPAQLTVAGGLSVGSSSGFIYSNAGLLTFLAMADDQILVGDTATAATARTLTNCTDSGGNHLNYTAATNSFSCGTTSSGAGGWTDAGTEINQSTLTDKIGIGGTALAALSVDNWADQTGLLIQAHSTQTSNIVTFEKSDGTDLFTWANDGTYTQAGSATPSMSLGGGTPATYPITFSLSGASDPVLTAVDTGWKWAANSEDLTTAFTSNTVTYSSSTSVATANFSSIALQESGIGVLNNDEIDASSELLAIMDDETGTGALVFGTQPTIDDLTLTGTPDAAAELGYDATQKTPTVYGGATAVAGSIGHIIASGVGTQTLTNSTVSDQDFTSMFTFPAGAIYTNKIYRVTVMTEFVRGTSTATIKNYLKIGSTKVYDHLSGTDLGDGLTSDVTFSFFIFGRAASGAAANVSISSESAGLASSSGANTVNQPVALATNGTLTVNFGVTYSGTGSTETIEQQAWFIEELN